MKRAWLLAFMAVLAACSGRTSMPQHATWVGTVELPEGVSVPLQMELNLADATPTGAFVVGSDRTPIPEITKNGNNITLGFSEYSAEIRANWNGAQLAGSYLRIRSDGTKSMKFEAAPVTDERPPGTVSYGPPVGNFQVFFQGEDKIDDSTVAKLWFDGGRSYGTFIAPDGDYGLMEGRPVGKAWQFSRFTGWQAIAITLERESGAWSGKFFSAANAKARPLVLKERDDLKIETPPDKRVTMKNPNAEFAFEGVSLSGETVRNTDDRFKGKAIIVDIMGTWCHNCLDEAPVLNRLQQQFGKDGLEIVGLSFEISEDAALAKKNLQLFKDRFGLTYTLLFAGSLDDENVKKRLHSQLVNFFAYPTGIFIDKDHKVRSIHSGFKGPGTGDEFQQQIREMEDLATKLVAGKL